MITNNGAFITEASSQYKSTYNCRETRLHYNLSKKELSFIEKSSKRLFDIAFSTVMLLFIFPVLFIVVALVNLVSSHHRYPIFFKQKRTGLHGKTFYCYKFRSMKLNQHAHSKQAEVNDPRVTKFGFFLRKYSLDEIPQFYNVLIGNMSVVGPRPHMLRHTVEYSSLIPRYMERHLVKPGITGYAQITGYRGETKQLHQMEGRVQRDLWYIQNRSLWLDLKIIVFTPGGMRSHV